MLDELHDEFFERLSGDEYFEDITILSERDSEDLNLDIQKSLGDVTTKGGKSGLCVIVRNPDVFREPGETWPSIKKVIIAIEVLEFPEVNRGANGTGKMPGEVSEHIENLFHYYRPDGIAGIIETEPSANNADHEASWPQQRVVLFSCQPLYTEELTKVSTPVITLTDDEAPCVATITCATAGSDIYYTTDGTYPRAGGATSTKYTVPVPVITPTTLRAVAYLTGSIASDSTTRTIE